MTSGTDSNLLADGVSVWIRRLYAEPFVMKRGVFDRVVFLQMIIVCGASREGVLTVVAFMAAELW